MNEKLYKYFEKEYVQNKFGHAFLIGNTKFKNIESTIVKIANDFIFKDGENFYKNSDIYIIKPENNNIKKEVILDLQKKLEKKSMYNKNKLYIIDEIETLNIYSANSMLKLLEEPENNIYALLISKNVCSVLSTIKSRCQTFTLNEDIEKFNIQLMDSCLITEFLNIKNNLENYSKLNIYKCNLLYKNYDKEKFYKFLFFIFNYYFDVLRYSVGNSVLYFENYVAEIITTSKLFNLINLKSRLLIINDIIILKKYNLNIKLLIDRFLIEIGECKNE